MIGNPDVIRNKSPAILARMLSSYRREITLTCCYGRGGRPNSHIGAARSCVEAVARCLSVQRCGRRNTKLAQIRCLRQKVGTFHSNVTSFPCGRPLLYQCNTAEPPDASATTLKPHWNSMAERNPMQAWRHPLLSISCGHARTRPTGRVRATSWGIQSTPHPLSQMCQ